MIAILTQATFDTLKPILLPSGVAIGTACNSTDGRCLIEHGFTQEDVDYLVGKGATMYETMPGDFVTPTEGV